MSAIQINAVFEVKDELGEMLQIPADLFALQKTFFDELFLVSKIIEYHYKKMDIIDIVGTQTPPIFAIVSITSELFQTLLNWGYSGQLYITKENAIDMLIALDYSLASNLVVFCANFIVSHVLAIENAWEILMLLRRMRVHFFNISEYDLLIATTENYIKANFDKLCDDEAFLNLEFDDVLQFLESDLLGVDSETIVCNAAIRWLDAKPKKREDFAFDIFSAIRMVYLPSDFLHRLLKNKFVNGLSYMEELVNTKLGRLMHKQCFSRSTDLSTSIDELEPEHGPRLKSSEIWVMNGAMDIQVFDCLPDLFLNGINIGGGTKLERPYHVLQRTGFAITKMQNDVYVVGGHPTQEWAKGLSECNILTLSHNHEEDLEWKEISPLNVERFGHCACSCGDIVYAFGGTTLATDWEYLSAMEFFSTQNGWMLSDQSNLLPRKWAASVALNGAIYVVGGCGQDGYVTELERFDPRSGQTDKLSGIPTPRGKLSVAVFRDKIYAAGGEWGHYIETGLYPECFDTVEIYDPVANAWTRGPSLNSARSFLGVVPNGSSLWALGGCNLAEKNFDVHMEVLESPYEQKWTEITPRNTKYPQWLSLKHANAFVV